jgi:hypothetical protein
MDVETEITVDLLVPASVNLGPAVEVRVLSATTYVPRALYAGSTAPS